MQFLHGMCPWTSHPVHISFSDCGPSWTSLPINYDHSCSMSTMFLGRVLFFQCSTMNQYVTRLLKCQSFTGCLAVKAHHIAVKIVRHHVVGCWLLVCLIAVWAVQVMNGLWMCLTTMGSTLGANFLSQVFLSYSQGEAQALGPWD